jgi:uncharacterized protein (DUF1330 family)
MPTQSVPTAHGRELALTVYALAQISIHDRDRYDRYVARFSQLLQRFDGRLLAADESPVVLEGQWPHQKVILIAFRDQAELQRWALSPEYQEISKDRVASTTGTVLIVAGLQPWAGDVSSPGRP